MMAELQCSCALPYSGAPLDAPAHLLLPLYRTLGGALPDDGRIEMALDCLDQGGVPDDVRAEFAGIAEFVTARQW